MGPSAISGVGLRMLAAAATAALVALSATPHASGAPASNSTALASVSRVVAVGSTDAPPAPVARLSGTDRYATAVAVSQAHKPAPNGQTTAFIASGENFPDALSIGWALGRASGDGALLFTRSTGLPAVTAAELQRLRPKNIVIIGGTGAVGASVAAALRQYTAGAVTRLSGTDRYATSVAISQAFAPVGVPVTYLATGLNFPDALVAGPVARQLQGNLLLTDPDTVPASTLAELRRTNPRKIVFVGGPGTVSDSVLNQVDAHVSGTITRVSGTSRYDTASALNASAGVDTSAVSVTTGVNYPDALAAATLGVPIVLTPPAALTEQPRRDLTRMRPTALSIIGGTGSVSAPVEGQIRALYTSVSAPVTGLTVTRHGVNNLSLSWVNPTDSNLGGITIVRKAGTSAPQSITDGTVAGHFMLGQSSPSTLVDRALTPTTSYAYGVFADNLMDWAHTEPATLATSTSAPEKVSVIAAGGGVSCAVGQTGTSACWGLHPPDAQPTSTAMRDVSVSLTSTPTRECLTSVAGEVSCGEFTMLPITHLPAVVKTSTGTDASCGITTSAALYCWGNNFFGQLGIGNTSSPFYLEAQRVVGVDSAVDVSVSDQTACAVTSVGGVVCWGARTDSFPPADGPLFNPTPIGLPGLESGIAKVDVAVDHSCALATDGRVLCWGYGESGALGDGGGRSSAGPVQARLPLPATSVSVGNYASCAVLTDGSLWCWGTGTWGLFGVADGPNIPVPQRISSLPTVGSVSVGSNLACVVDANSHARCWGRGPVGDGVIQDRLTPTLVDFPATP